jgi:RNA polymerase sigma-70 factor (ECF subfamily)
MRPEPNIFESTALPDFIRRIRAGDDQAARELVERYWPVIRCEVRLRLRDPRLYRRFDWIDIRRSAMASFFVRVVEGSFAPQGLLPNSLPAR